MAGLVGQYPVGGVAWDYLQYVLGLRRLGHDVYYHEDTWSWPYHPVAARRVDDGSFSACYIASFFDRYAPELHDRWHYLHLHQTSFGMSRSAFDEVARTADLFLNVSGASMLPERLAPSCVRVFLDTDPGYNQIVLTERFSGSEHVARWCASVASHDRHFTYAENIHDAACLVPRAGLSWQTTRTPIVLALWDAVARDAPAAGAPWTTVLTWDAFGGRKVEYGGVEYTDKRSELIRIADLPRRVDVPIRLALGGRNPPVERLAADGWEVVDAPSATLTPARYQAFIAGSRGEVSVAKHVYAAMRSGWFSCRSACYLAARRPVVVQDTGFSTILPTGSGVLAFRTLEEAAAGVRDVEARYEHHSAAARAMADEYFDAGKVLPRLLDDAMGSAPIAQ